ncbi:MAG: beta-ketoacyl-ACP synthase II [Anaerolineae bacterium]|nr:beta-ketoacyl-ACP synthase II [Anaerolineae bacterium]
MSNRRRVVVTGIGAITPLALTAEETWQGLLAGRSGVGRITQFDASNLSSQIAGEVKGFDPSRYMPAKEARRMSRASQLAVATAQEAVSHAGLELPLGERAGVLIGVAVGGMEWLVEQVEVYKDKGVARVSPFAVPAALANMPSHHVSCWAQALGPITTIVTACATGTQAVGEASEFIRRGAADVMIAGGVEGLIIEVAIAGFCAMRALSTHNDEPERASRPFDIGRDGFVYSEGCGLLILESLEHAEARGARILAEVLGHAASSDGFHVAQPDPEGKGAIRAMRWALQDAQVTPEQVDYINAHGPATPINDPIETRAIKEIFGEYAYKVPISSTKSMIGHPMGGAGAIEAVTCVQTLRDQIIHQTANLETPDPECDLDYVPGAARRAEVNVTLSNSFGLGGQNACLVLGTFEE